LKKAGMIFSTPNTRPWREESQKIPDALLKSGHLTDWSYKEALRRFNVPPAH